MSNLANKRVAIVLGSSGLIGGNLVNLLLQDESYGKVRILVRRKTNMMHPKLEEQLVNFDALSAYDDLFEGDDVFCCLGTTIKKAGSPKKFRKVDYDYPLEAAKLAIEKEVKNYLLITSMGADSKAFVLYSRVKGELEEAIKELEFHGTHIFQPSLLLGDRSETRFGEGIGQKVMEVVNPLMFGPLEKYKAIDAKDVAYAMADVAKNDPKGVFIYQSDVIQTMADKAKQE